MRASEGPERIAVPWWDRTVGEGPSTSSDAAANERDYYRVGTEDGRWLWLFRRDARWFVHGEWA